jgi:hypothetical protein
MGRSRRQQLIDQIRKNLQVASGQRRFKPMWARLHLYERNPRLADFPLDAQLPAGLDIAVPGPVLPELYGGLWDTLHESWVPDAKPERPEDITVFTIAANQLELVTYQKAPVMRLMILGGPGSGKTTTLSLSSLFHGAGLLNQRSHLTWGMVGATNERVRDVVVKDLDKTIPPAWVDDKRTDAITGNFHRLVNGCEFEYVSGQEPSKRKGTKIQGRSWNGAGVDETQNLHDRVQMDIDERGRREGRGFFVTETATNFGLGHFELRKERYKASRYHDIKRLNPNDNPFIDPGYWERFKEFYSEHDWRQRMMAEDVAAEQLVYASFKYNDNIMPAPRPDSGLDVTREVTAKRFNDKRGWNWVVGTDWGALCTVSIWLKAFRNPRHGDIEWWAMREVTSGSHTHAGQHAKKLAGFCHPGDFIVVADPGINTKDVDKSDYELARREGLTVRPAHFEPIRVKHRVSMLNALLCDASGRRRFFIDCDNNRAPACPKLVQSFLTQQYDDRGNPENVRKDYSDPTHWPAATAYGLYPMEQLRGVTTFDLITGGINGPEDPILVKARQIEARRS